MNEKVKVAVFDKDGKIRHLGNKPLSKDGSRIKIKEGGRGQFKPLFDNHSYLEFPKPKYLGGGWDRIYFVRNHAKKCVDFKDDPATVYGPDPDVVINAAEDAIRKSMKQEDPETPIILYLMFGAVLIILLKVLGVIA